MDAAMSSEQFDAIYEAIGRKMTKWQPNSGMTQIIVGYPKNWDF